MDLPLPCCCDRLAQSMELWDQEALPPPPPSHSSSTVPFSFPHAAPPSPPSPYPPQGMEDWDQETLEKVINEKHAMEKPTNTTSIICKHFLEAVEKKLYGW